MRNLHFLFLILIASFATAQIPDSLKVATQLDRDLIKIGEEVKLGITVEATARDLVVFPEQQTMGALEVINSYPVDSTRVADKIQLFKQYGLTQFDSGDYWVPQLKILKNSAQLYSDSLLISVREVVVDTTEQNLYPIKEKMDLETNVPPDYSWMWWLLLLIPLGLIVFLLSRKREKKTYEETLQPYEWTRFRLKKLDESGLLNSRDWKAYYTELTYILRRYIDSKVYGHTLESTTGQLIRELKIAMSEKGMHITDKSQQHLEQILQKADLVKFASAGGDAISAKEDRHRTTDIIYNIHQVLPPPTEEELMQDARYRRKQELKRQAERTAIGIAAGVILLIVAAGSWIYVDGWDEVKDQVFGNELRELYEQDWITTTYGLPSVRMSTPDVLVRTDSMHMPEEIKKAVALHNNFEYGEWEDPLMVQVTTLNFQQQLPEDINAQAFINPLIANMESEGASNIVMLDDEVQINGNKGIELAGTLDHGGDEYQYSILLFSKMGGLQQVMIVVEQEDEEDEAREYGRMIMERMKQSIEIKIPAGLEPKKKQTK
ncbi:MAG: hypothetical protein WBG46_15605 [Nonlabens sp.]